MLLGATGVDRAHSIYADGSSCLVIIAPMPAIIVIPARLAAMRFPNKPLADIHGKPMVVRVAERALASGAAAVFVATDHDGVAAAVTAQGIQAVMTSPDCASGTDRLAEVAARLGWADDVVVVADKVLLSVAPRVEHNA